MDAEILGPGEGERTADRTQRTVTIKADRDEFVLTWSRYEPGQTGPDLHVHREHDDCFYVLDGELEFMLGPGAHPVRGGAGTFVLVPPLVVHTFRNDSATTAHFLNLHAPGCGFAGYLRALRDGRRKEAERFDSYDPPADGGRSPDDVVIGEPERHLLRGEARPGDTLRDTWILAGALTLHGGAEVGPGAWVAAAEVESGSAQVLEIRA